MKQLLVDFLSPVESKIHIIEGKSSNGKLILRGKLQEAEALNGNNRRYPRETLEREIQRYIQGPIALNNATGELDHPECFSSQHSALTLDKGWVRFEDLMGDEFIATINYKTKELEYQQIIKLINQPYKGEMINIKSKTFNTTVTPNHRFLITNQHDLNLNRGLRFVEAKNLKKGHLIPKRSIYNKISPEFVEIENRFGKVKITSSIFSQFMGWWLSEGWISSSKKSNCIFIAQVKDDCISIIKEICNDLCSQLNINFNTYIKKTGEHEFNFSSKVLNLYLSQFGLCNDKFIPKEIKNLGIKEIKLFLGAYLLGDGHKQNNQEVYYTTSKQMSEDLEELINLTGFMSSTSTKLLGYDKYLIEGLWVKDFDYYTKKELYKNKIIEKKEKNYTGKTLYSVRRKYSDYYHMSECKITNIYYDDNIYCVSVPNQTILVMGPDRSSFWSGNSTVINLKNVSHNIKKIWWEGNSVMGELELLPTPSGKIAEALVLSGIPLGISSRAQGSVKQIGEEIEVQDDLDLLCWDLVSIPSTDGAYMTLSEGLTKTQIKEINKYSTVNSLITEIICTVAGYCSCELKN